MSKQLRPSYVVSRYDRGRHLLAPAGMWNPEAHRLGYRRVSQQDVFYFGRRHFLSTPVDQLFDPPDEAEKPVVVQRAEITRPKPTVERERRGIDLRVGVVRIDDVETTDDHFAYGAQAESGSRLVRNGDLDARSPAYRAGLARGWRQGFEATWWAASVMPNASSTGTSNSRSSASSVFGPRRELAERMKRSVGIRGPPECDRRQLRTSWWKVGTPEYQVTPCVVANWQRPIASGSGGNTTRPPEASVASTDPISPWT